jgi:hypothetical protein
MDDLGKLLTIGLAILAIATAAGFGLQRGRISALREQLKDSDDELVRKDRRLTAAEGEVKQLKTDLAALARVVTGEAHWIAIGEKLDLHHGEAEVHWKRDEQLLEEIRDRLPPARSK